MRIRLRSTFRVAAAVSLVLTLTTLVIGLIVYHITHEALEVQLDHRIIIETQALREGSDDDGRKMASLIRERDGARSTASLGYILVDRNGRRLAGELDAEVPAESGYRELFFYDGGRRIAQAITTALPDGERLVVAADREVIDEMDASLTTLFGLALVSMLVVSIGGAWTVGAVTRSRLRRIDGAAQAIIGGDIRQRMPIDGTNSEFDRVSGTLNLMLDRISRLLDNLRLVSSDVAHDLRTPLSRLHNSLEEAQHAPGEQARLAAIDAARAQAEDLLALFSALLRISEVEAGSLRAGFCDIGISELVSEVVELYRPDAESADHILVASIKTGVPIHGDPRLLRQMMANLLDNALRHTPPGTTIRVTLSTQEKAVLIVVEDDGPGVAAEDALRLFERFSRAERSRSTPGHGLGLAFVAAVAAIHGGSAEIRPAAGFRLEVSLR